MTSTVVEHSEGERPTDTSQGFTTMTMPDERLRALGEMRNLLLEISDPALHVPRFRMSIPMPWASRRAGSLLGYYPLLIQLSEAAQLEISQREWLTDFWIDPSHLNAGMPGENGDQGASLPTARLLAFAGSGNLLREIADASELSAAANADELRRRIKFVLRHFPEEWQLQNAARSPQPLRNWIGFETAPEWWCDPPRG